MKNPITDSLSRLTVSFGDGDRCILPYIYFRVPPTSGSDKATLSAVMLQYDDPAIDVKHKTVGPANFAEAPMVEVSHNGNSELIYLARAIQKSPDDVRVETPFANGKLWGWFPKHLVE